MIRTVKWSAGVPEPDLKETLRYMGVRGDPSPELVSLAQKGIEKVRSHARCRGCWARVPVEIPDEDSVIICGETVQTKSLARHLKNCGEAYLIAVTAGMGIDRLIRTTAALSQAECLAIDAAGSSAVEWACDELNRELCETALSEGKSLRWRFSPGYGDFPLDYQLSLFKLMELGKNLGITLNDSLLMTPIKSVTAVIGIEKRQD
ncbi:MAG: hypothetical protein IJL71_02720 [Oscillospiraceae bacterium]|nr:hypothetical protein [Oscillospiraceae bacterium]